MYIYVCVAQYSSVFISLVNVDSVLYQYSLPSIEAFKKQ